MYSRRILKNTEASFVKVTTVRLEEDVLKRLDGIAEAMNRPRNWVIQQAVNQYLEYEAWFVEQVKAGLREVEEGKVAAHDKVVARFKKWGVDAG